MNFGIYIHIPYCLQKCHYCDFTTFSLDHKIKMADYADLLVAEIRNRHSHIPHRNVDTIYFGGGTPSLLAVQDILTILTELNNAGFKTSPEAEITIEINPGTIDQERLDQYLAAGINRFSLGVQTFNDHFLKKMGREHSALQTWKDIELLNKKSINFTVDFLFGLPDQTMAEFRKDLHQFKSLRPKHLSAYNLTVPTGHPMSLNRADDEVQADMFDAIESELLGVGVKRYELSNYSRPGFEGKHNSLYWNDKEYWGLGVSAHSYLKLPQSSWGTRFWNSPAADNYLQQSQCNDQNLFLGALPAGQVENLKLHESLTDFCHTQLRKISGLKWTEYTEKYGTGLQSALLERFRKAQKQGLAKESEDGFTLTTIGRKLSNRSFLEFTFLPEDLS